MENEKDFNFSDYASIFNSDFSKSNDSMNLLWILLLFMPLFFGNNSSSMESYLKGKIEAYENVLKGFENNER